MRFDLRSLMLFMALGPPLLTCPWWISHPHWTLHSAAAAAAIASYSVGVLLLAGVFQKAKSWKRPPKKTPLLWAAVAASLLSAGSATVFMASVPPLTKEEGARQEERERLERAELDARRRARQPRQ